MKFSYAKGRMIDFEYQRNVLLVLSAILLVILLLMSLYIFFKNERVIILPPEVRREFWAEGNRFSPEYLEEQAVYMAHLALDVNQINVQYNTEILMRYADISACTYLKDKLEKDLKKLKENNASTNFDVKKVKVYPNTNTVHISGMLNRYVGSKQINSNLETYEVRFKTFRGRLMLHRIAKI